MTMSTPAAVPSSPTATFYPNNDEPVVTVIWPDGYGEIAVAHPSNEDNPNEVLAGLGWKVVSGAPLGAFIATTGYVVVQVEPI